MSTDEKPTPTQAASMWVAARGGDAEESADGARTADKGDGLDWRLDFIAGMAEYVAGNLARGTMGRRQAVDRLRVLYQKVSELRRDMSSSAPSPKDEQERWNNFVGELAPWEPPTLEGENSMLYGNGVQEKAKRQFRKIVDGTMDVDGAGRAMLEAYLKEALVWREKEPSNPRTQELVAVIGNKLAYLERVQKGRDRG
jgi:hypothetical protein